MYKALIIILSLFFMTNILSEEMSCEINEKYIHRDLFVSGEGRESKYLRINIRSNCHFQNENHCKLVSVSYDQSKTAKFYLGDEEIFIDIPKENLQQDKNYHFNFDVTKNHCKMPNLSVSKKELLAINNYEVLNLNFIKEEKRIKISGIKDVISKLEAIKARDVEFLIEYKDKKIHSYDKDQKDFKKIVDDEFIYNTTVLSFNIIYLVREFSFSQKYVIQ